MQQRERRGAWVLMVIILIFGVVVFGYGCHRRNQAKKTATEQIRKFKEKKIKEEQEKKLHEIDSVNNGEKSKNVKGYIKEAKKRKSRKSNSKTDKSKDIEREKVRDILADTIQVR